MIFGATGMVGQGVLHKCLSADGVNSVLVVGRSSFGLQHPKLRAIVRTDLFDNSTIEGDLRGYDACIFCLGISSAGMSEEQYHRLTYELTLTAAQSLAWLNPGMTFCYVSGTGTDSTKRGRSIYARVKGKTETAFLRLPFKAAFMFRPGYIQPVKGVRSKTTRYRILYAILGPLYPLW